MPSPEQITTAISTIDQLSGWLENAGLDQVAIARSVTSLRLSICPWRTAIIQGCAFLCQESMILRSLSGSTVIGDLTWLTVWLGAGVAIALEARRFY